MLFIPVNKERRQRRGRNRQASGYRSLCVSEELRKISAYLLNGLHNCVVVLAAQDPHGRQEQHRVPRRANRLVDDDLKRGIAYIQSRLFLILLLFLVAFTAIILLRLGLGLGLGVAQSGERGLEVL